MATLVIIIAFWLILIGIYGAISLLKEESLGRSPVSKPAPARRAPRFPRVFNDNEALLLPRRPEPRQATPSDAFEPAAQERATSAARQPEPEVVGSLFSEVDMLRAQVEHLRSEIYAISSRPERAARPRTRRYSPGAYTYLPLILRRHVHEARRIRGPMGA